MFCVYAIKSEKDERVYVGMCVDVEIRLKEHNAGKTKSTKGFRPWKLIYIEKVATRVEARKREKYLKSGIGKEFLRSLVP
jgi:putative endonuclease